MGVRRIWHALRAFKAVLFYGKSLPHDSEFKKFDLTYHFCGQDWGVTFFARSKQEAELRKIAMTNGDIKEIEFEARIPSR